MFGGESNKQIKNIAKAENIVGGGSTQKSSKLQRLEICLAENQQKNQANWRRINKQIKKIAKAKFVVGG